MSYLTKIFEFRFVNLVDENHDDIENIWEQVKQVRKKFLTNNYDPECDGNANTIVEDDIKKIIDNVVENLTKHTKYYDSYEFVANGNYYDYGNMIEDILETEIDKFLQRTSASKITKRHHIGNYKYHENKEKCRKVNCYNNLE